MSRLVFSYPFNSLLEVQKLRREMIIRSSTSSVFLPLVLPKGVFCIMSVKIWPHYKQLRSNSLHPLWFESQALITEGRSFGSCFGRPAIFLNGLVLEQGAGDAEDRGTGCQDQGPGSGFNLSPFFVHV